MARRFKAQESTVTKELINTMKKMGCQNLRIENGNLLDDNDTECKIIFDRNGKRYLFSCDNYSNKLDNFRAAQLTVEYLYRALESYGVTQAESKMEAIMEQFLLGFEFTPENDTLKLGYETEWYQVLGVNPNATREEIKNAFRSLARMYHPDVGGEPEQFRKIKKAYDQGMEQNGH